MASRRVAVIGSGVAGLSAASILHKNNVDFTVFEKDARAGGHAWTFDAEGTPVDIGFMVFNQITYPNMIAWFEEMGVAIEPSDMSFAVSVRNGWLEWSSDSASTVFAQRSNLANVNFHRMLLDMRRFKLEVLQVLSDPNPNLDVTLGDFLTSHNYSPYFVEYYMLPVCAAVWSCPTTTTRDFSAYFIFRFMKNHHMLQIFDRPQWLTVAGRSRSYVQRICEKFGDRVKTSCAITSISRRADGKLLLADVHGQTHEFDDVILASHAPDTTRLVESVATPDQKAWIQAFPYQESNIYVHRDTTLMPIRREVWASWNFLGDSSEGCAVTYWLNRLQNLPESSGNVFVTLNPPTPPQAHQVIYNVRMTHPVPTVAAAKAQLRNLDIQGHGNLWFCGAYMHNGFHEDGCLAGLEIGNHYIKNPWTSLPLTVKMDVSYGASLARKMLTGYLRRGIGANRLTLLERGGQLTVIGDLHTEPRLAAFVEVKQPEVYVEWWLHGKQTVVDALSRHDISTDNGANLISILAQIDRSQARVPQLAISKKLWETGSAVSRWSRDRLGWSLPTPNVMAGALNEKGLVDAIEHDVQKTAAREVLVVSDLAAVAVAVTSKMNTPVVVGVEGAAQLEAVSQAVRDRSCAASVTLLSSLNEGRFDTVYVVCSSTMHDFGRLAATMRRFIKDDGRAVVLAVLRAPTHAPSQVERQLFPSCTVSLGDLTTTTEPFFHVASVEQITSPMLKPSEHGADDALVAVVEACIQERLLVPSLLTLTPL